MQTCENWVTAERAAHSAKCKVGNGQMDPVNDPLWYLYSGKQDTTAVSFDSEPWDATCEAEGTGTHDTCATDRGSNSAARSRPLVRL